MGRHRWSGVAALAWPVMVATAALATAAAAVRAQPRVSSPAPVAVIGAQAPTAESAESLAARADQARLAGRTDEAIALYRRALAHRPRWPEGWWHLGTLLYDRDEYAEAAGAFRRAADLAPAAGNAWAMLGLCEFRLGREESALDALRRAGELGIAAEEIRRVALYHEGLLWIGRREFERAQEVLDRLAADGIESDELTFALGLAVLRRRPAEVPPDDAVLRTAIEQAGRAEQLAARRRQEEATAAYERLARDFPQIRHAHYALGRHLTAIRQPERAVEAFEREIARFPDHVPARLGIAAIKAATNPAAALRYAEEAVRLNPQIPLGHYLLGSLLLHTGELDRAIRELELAERDVKDDPAVYYALARAYARAGREADAERARAAFRRLTEARESARRPPGSPR